MAVKVFWDADNCPPRASRARATAARLTRAARAFGAVDGDVMAYANAATMSRLGEVSARGVTWTRCEDGADAADGALAKDALAWIASVASTASSASGLAAPVFSTKRQRALRGVSAEEEAMAREEGEFWAREAREATPVGGGGGSTIDAIVRGRTHVMMLVTNDNDMKIVMDYARARGVCVVVVSNVSPAAASGGMKTKRSRNVAKSIGTVGMNNAYFEAVKLEGQRRELSRLKLLQSADGALLWDPNRKFDVREDEGVEGEPVAGDVVGVWRPDKGGIGRWYA